jgi:sulfur transfer complex TusBCD TusB component (DsrH family)
MKKRLLLVRNPDAPTLEYIDTNRKNQEIVLLQNGVFSSNLKEKGAKLLENDVKARKLKENGNLINYDELLDLILWSDQIITI